MGDGTGLAEALLGLDGFRVLEVDEHADEVVITVETIATVVGCGVCGIRAESQGRARIAVRDLACFGRPTRLVWVKRLWRCREVGCDARTWTETSPVLDPQVVLTRRAARRRAARSVPWPARSRRWPRSSGSVGGR